MAFNDVLSQFDWEEVSASISNKTADDVKLALKTESPTMEDFKALVSPAAEPFLEQMAIVSKERTQKRFGKTMQLYIPLYLSNECANSCVYCGFNHANEIDRLTLSKEQILDEVKAIKELGFEHLLLVTGEHPANCGYNYLKEAIEIIKPYFSLISIEVQPLSQEEYAGLNELGLNTVYVYQETYNRKNYNNYHPRGKKADFEYRLHTPDRIGLAGAHRIGIGCLLGLEDWRVDSFFTALHVNYLEKTYWQTKYSVAFPRLRPHAGQFEPNCVVTDKNLVQLILAYRIFNSELELSLSTRERPLFRDNMVGLGITSMSAGSKTEPGGYAVQRKALEQFQVSDDRTPIEVTQMIKAKGYEAVWKDWDRCMQ